MILISVRLAVYVCPAERLEMLPSQAFSSSRMPTRTTSPMTELARLASTQLAISQTLALCIPCLRLSQTRIVCMCAHTCCRVIYARVQSKHAMNCHTVAPVSGRKPGLIPPVTASAVINTGSEAAEKRALLPGSALPSACPLRFPPQAAHATLVLSHMLCILTLLAGTSPTPLDVNFPPQA